MAKAAADVDNLPYADGDFYGFEQLLPDAERERLHEIRDFMAREVKPIAVDCWNRGEFPMEIIPKLAELDIVSPVHRQGYSSLFAGLAHAEFTRADASIATFMGVHDGLFTGSVEALASEEQKAAWLPDIYALKKIGAFGLKLGPQRRQALDWQCHLLRLGGDLRPRRGRQPGQGLHGRHRVGGIQGHQD